MTMKTTKLSADAGKTRERVVRAPSTSSTRRRTCACGRPIGVDGECDQCKRRRLQRAAASAEAPARTAVRGRGAGPHAAGGAGGRSLDPSVRHRMEIGFGVSFAQVRVHDDTASHAAAASLGARAFTTGQDVHFAAQQYRPASRDGIQLLAHELAHTIQQRGAVPTNGVQAYSVDSVDSPLEREAESAARTVAHGGAALVRAGSAAGVPALVQRQPSPVHGDPDAGANRAMRDGVPYEKWSPSVEALYRKAGDTERAHAVRRCRELGKSACIRVLTLAEVSALAKLIESSGGDKKKFEAGLAGALPLLAGATLPATAPATAPLTAAQLAATAANDNAARLVLIEGGEAAAAAGEGAAVAVSVGAVVTAAAALVAAVYIAFAIYSLIQIAKLQAALRDKGFVILEDPLAQAICTGCHSAPARPDPFKKFDLESKTPLLENKDLTRFFPPTKPKVDDKPATDPLPLPKPEKKEEDKDCPFPTGLSKKEPIGMRWLKPRVDDYYPKRLTLTHGVYGRDDPGNPRKLPLGQPLGVPPRYWPRIGKIMQLTKEERGKKADQFKATLKDNGFDWAGFSPDHVQDLDWEGPDEFENLWPMDSDANRDAGSEQNQNQRVTYCETKKGPPVVAQTLKAFKMSPGHYGRYFMISTVNRWKT